jgi:hypothetical protein
MEANPTVATAVWPHGAQPELNMLPSHGDGNATYVVAIPGISRLSIFFDSRDELEEWMENLRCLVVDSYVTDPSEEGSTVNIHDIVDEVSREFAESRLEGEEEVKHCNKCNGTVTV